MRDPIDTNAIRREAEEGLELANKATPGEWIVLKAIDGLYPIAQVPFAREGYQWYTIEAGYPNRSSSKIDAEFIADARTRVPSQAELLKECADEIDRLKQQLAEANRLRADEAMFATQHLAKSLALEPYEQAWTEYRRRLTALGTEDGRDAVRHMDQLLSDALHDETGIANDPIV